MYSRGFRASTEIRGIGRFGQIVQSLSSSLMIQRAIEDGYRVDLVRRGEAGMVQRHGERLVPEQFLHRREVDSRHDELRRKRMAKFMEAKVHDLGLAASGSKQLRHIVESLPVVIREDVSEVQDPSRRRRSAAHSYCGTLPAWPSEEKGGVERPALSRQST